MNQPLLSPPSGPLQVPLTAPTAAEVPPTSFDSPLQFSLVIPTYNERGNVAKIVAQLARLLDGFIPDRYELILVDDDSPDRTWQVAQDLTETYPQLTGDAPSAGTRPVFSGDSRAGR